MVIIKIDRGSNSRLERLSLVQNISKGSVALKLCENLFLSRGGAHRTTEKDIGKKFLFRGGAHRKTERN